MAATSPFYRMLLKRPMAGYGKRQSYVSLHKHAVLAYEVARLQLGANDSLPAAHLYLDTTALIVTGGFLPRYPTVGLDVGNL